MSYDKKNKFSKRVLEILCDYVYIYNYLYVHIETQGEEKESEKNRLVLIG